MLRKTFIRFYAGLLLLILSAAHVGQQVHIFTEDLQRFAAFSGDRMPDNGADSRVVAQCLVCSYHFFSFIEDIVPAHVFYAEQLAVLLPEATQCCCCDAVLHAQLRAPPVA